MRMTAAVMYEQGLPLPYATSRPFRIEEVELEGPGDGEVLVEVRGAGMCHSDLSTVAGMRKRPLPVVGGHEGAGIVREVGKGVKTLRPGDHVVMSNFASCGHCRLCNEGRNILCESVTDARVKGLLSNGERRLSLGGKPVNHYSGVSCFAQYAVAMPDTLIRVDDRVPLDIAALFGCAVVTGAGAVFNSARVRPGQYVAVIGLGGVGLNAVMAARVAGAAEIIGIDINENKFALARELGCTNTFLGNDPEIARKVQALTEGGVHYTFEVSGAKPAMTTAYAITSKGGEIICVGLGATNDMYQYPHAQLVASEKVIRGSLMGSGNAQRDIPRYVRMYLDGKLPVDKLKSGTMGFDGLNLSMDRLEHGDVVRQILLPHGGL